jgi:hypothetical protein
VLDAAQLDAFNGSEPFKLADGVRVSAKHMERGLCVALHSNNALCDQNLATRPRRYLTHRTHAHVRACEVGQQVLALMSEGHHVCTRLINKGLALLRSTLSELT